jgi:hypothetical protein
MYSTCLFCHASLGTNEVIEHFPVGRRLAFDPAKGRLWVVCRKCERWNLTPLEERWEAIEECERLYRGTRLRASTENIGLARLAEGLELVRIGDPLRPEFAAWRYGDQFGRRRTRQLMWAGAGLAAIGTLVVGGAALGASLGGAWYGIYQLSRLAVHGRPGKIVAQVPDAGGSVVVVRRRHLERIRLISNGPAGEWGLQLRRGVQLTGRNAERAASQLLPALNRFGGSRQQVGEAVHLIDVAPTPASLFSTAARVGTPDRRGGEQAGKLARLPVTMRLALEMVSHEDAERRAMEGELAELERAWQEAEEIAAIADNLLLPENVDQFLRAHDRR